MKTKWIDASKTLPANTREVLVVSYKYSDYEVFRAYLKNGEWYDPEMKADPIIYSGVDYWMEFPKAPINTRKNK